MSEKFVLVRKELHLGYVKETFRAGAVLEHDEEKHILIVDGRKFNDTRDLEVLKRQADNNPDNPWILPWSEDAVQMARDSIPKVVSKIKPRPGEGMKVIKSDEDLMDDPIDIKNTQVSKNKAAEKIAARTKVKTDGMEVIRGDESVEDRIANLKGKNDIASVAERVRLKATGSARMAVVRDDSLGSAGGSRAAALNAGQIIKSRDEIEAQTDSAKAAADARKREVEARRKSVAPVETPDDEIATLRAKIAQLEAKKNKPIVVKEASEAGEGEVGLLDAETTPTGSIKPIIPLTKPRGRPPGSGVKKANKIVGE